MSTLRDGASEQLCWSSCEDDFEDVMWANMHSSTRAPWGLCRHFSSQLRKQKIERLDGFSYVLLLDTSYALIADALTHRPYRRQLGPRAHAAVSLID